MIPGANQTNQTKPTKTNIPNQTFQTKPTKPNLPNQTYQIKPTKPNLPTKLTKPNLINKTYQTKPTPHCAGYRRRCYPSICSICGLRIRPKGATTQIFLKNFAKASWSCSWGRLSRAVRRWIENAGGSPGGKHASNHRWSYVRNRVNLLWWK